MTKCKQCGREHSRRGKFLCLNCDKPTHCQRCGMRPDNGSLTLLGVYLCDSCYDLRKEGRDHSTKIARKVRTAMRNSANAKHMETEGEPELAAWNRQQAAQAGAELKVLREVTKKPTVSLGEIVPEANCWIRNTLMNPDVASMDASADRIDLMLQGGTDVAAMAVDAAHSIQAQNSLEKMLAHQLAVVHKAAMTTMSRATRHAGIDVGDQVRLMNAAIRAMETYQKGLLTLQRLRTGGQQTVIVQHVQVASGGQAVIGQVQAGGGKKNER